jgi:hypothetical protein
VADSELSLHVWSRSLAVVFLSGDLGAAPFQLIKVSKNLGVIHLLVLSGSQVAFFASVSRAFWAPVLRKCFGLDERYQRIFLGIFLLLWVRSFAFPPPLTRALFFGLANLYSSNFKTASLAPKLFLFHVLFFPEHLAFSGFYLSWASFLLVAFLNSRQMGRSKVAFYSTIFCTIIVCLFMNSPWPGWGSWVGIIVANLTLGIVADRIWFPVLAGFHFFSFMGQALGILEAEQSRQVGVDLMAALIRPFLLPLMP